MSDTPRDLIARSLHALYGHVHADAEEWDNLWKLRPDAYRREADEVLTALDEAGYTIVKRDGWQTVGHLAPGTELKISTTRRCPSALRISGARCDLDEGHTGWHRHNGNGNGYTATWVNEPTEWLADEPRRDQGGPVSALDDLIERLERASAELAWLSSSSALLKREGIELALSYAREAKRDDDNDAKAEAAFQEYLDEEDQ